MNNIIKNHVKLKKRAQQIRDKRQERIEAWYSCIQEGYISKALLWVIILCEVTVVDVDQDSKIADTLMDIMFLRGDSSYIGANGVLELGPSDLKELKEAYFKVMLQ